MIPTEKVLEERKASPQYKDLTKSLVKKFSTSIISLSWQRETDQ